MMMMMRMVLTMMIRMVEYIDDIYILRTLKDYLRTIFGISVLFFGFVNLGDWKFRLINYVCAKDE